MIQRIQTIWLLLSSLSILLLVKMPLYTGTLIDGTVEDLMTAERLHLMILAIFLLILPLIAIFLFKNRLAQKKIIWVHILMNMVMVFLFWLAKDAFVSGDILKYSSSRYGLGVVVPILSLVFDVMAYRGIRFDEKLLKSIDKLR